MIITNVTPINSYLIYPQIYYFAYHLSKIMYDTDEEPQQQQQLQGILSCAQYEIAIPLHFYITAKCLTHPNVKIVIQLHTLNNNKIFIYPANTPKYNEMKKKIIYSNICFMLPRTFDCYESK